MDEEAQRRNFACRDGRVNTDGAAKNVSFEKERRDTHNTEKRAFFLGRTTTVAFSLFVLIQLPPCSLPLFTRCHFLLLKYANKFICEHVEYWC